MNKSDSDNNEVEIDKRIYKMRAEICRTLANPVRIQILDNLKDGERTVNELVSITGLRQANVSQHLAIMRQTGLVVNRQHGKIIYYSLKNPFIMQACDIIKQFLVEKLTENHKIISSVKITDKT